MPLRRPKTSKNPPFFSHEFVIQNHADIVSCVAMVFIIGLMFQATNPFAVLFVSLQHNVTTEANEETAEPAENLFTYGRKDLFTGFFYMLICVVVHAVVQEYFLDKLNRRMHLSKTKHSKFNESGKLMVFYASMAIWGGDIIIRESLVTSISSLWEGYPHVLMPFLLKFFFLIQLAYWVHSYPELYFYKVKKEEMPARIQYTTLYLIFITAAYLLNFTHVALCLLVLHYTVESIFHFSRLLYFSEKTELANTGFMVWNCLFVLVRLASITLAVLTFWHGLQQEETAEPADYTQGNFNTQIIRINCLAAVCLLQAWMMWNFITFHLRRMRERAQLQTTKKVAPSFKKKTEKKSKGGRSEEDTGDDSGDGGVVSENGSTVRPRTPKAKRQ